MGRRLAAPSTTFEQNYTWARGRSSFTDVPRETPKLHLARARVTGSPLGAPSAASVYAACPPCPSRQRSAGAQRTGSTRLWRLLVLALPCNCTAPAAEAPRQLPASLDLEAARAYVLELVNGDRARHGQEPVVRDAAAERAAQAHADDMAGFGYTAHWGRDGSVPEERYTRAGGEHFVRENAACFFDGEERPLDPDARFSSAALEQLEAAFTEERPPHDGHRRNILDARHTGVGVGIAQPLGIDLPCLTQEFVDVRGEYAPLPARAHVGETVRVAGELSEPVVFGGVGLSRIEPRQPLGVARLNGTSSYRVPPPFQAYFPAGYVTAQAVFVEGRRFSIEVPLSDGRRPGRYGISVWAAYPGRKNELVMVSLRVVEVL